MATDTTGVPMPLSRPDNLAIVEESARAELDNLKKQTEAVEQILRNVVAARSKMTGERQIPPVRPDEYKGQRAVSALESYLRARRGMKIPLRKAAADLIAGGADPGQPRGRSSDLIQRLMHNLKIALPNRSETFTWEPVVATKKNLPGVPKGKDIEILVWLSETADIPRRRKRT